MPVRLPEKSSPDSTSRGLWVGIAIGVLLLASALAMGWQFVLLGGIIIALMVGYKLWAK